MSQPLTNDIGANLSWGYLLFGQLPHSCSHHTFPWPLLLMLLLSFSLPISIHTHLPQLCPGPCLLAFFMFSLNGTVLDSPGLHTCVQPTPAQPSWLMERGTCIDVYVLGF